MWFFCENQLGLPFEKRKRWDINQINNHFCYKLNGKEGFQNLSRFHFYFTGKKCQKIIVQKTILFGEKNSALSVKDTCLISLLKESLSQQLPDVKSCVDSSYAVNTRPPVSTCYSVVLKSRDEMSDALAGSLFIILQTHITCIWVI